MTKKAAMEHAQKSVVSGITLDPTVWHKQVVKKANGEKGVNEICILVVQYTAPLTTRELTRLFCFVNDQQKFSCYVD